MAPVPLTALNSASACGVTAESGNPWLYSTTVLTDAGVSALCSMRVSKEFPITHISIILHERALQNPLPLRGQLRGEWTARKR
eukprot:3249483-Rhodomonas_salina.2